MLLEQYLSQSLLGSPGERGGPGGGEGGGGDGGGDGGEGGGDGGEGGRGGGLGGVKAHSCSAEIWAAVRMSV